jgi:hypothetical protein
MGERMQGKYSLEKGKHKWKKNARETLYVCKIAPVYTKSSIRTYDIVRLLLQKCVQIAFL